MARRRILFVVEHVTWSQIVRALVLARGLDPRRFEVHFASASFDEVLFRGTRFRRWPIHSISPSDMERAIATGRRVHDQATLARYVEEELRLFDAVRPDLVVSDLRWSTAISAPKSGVPCATIVNAYWSPHAVRDRFPMPDHPIVRLLGVERAEKHFPTALPWVLAHFASPVNRLRRRYGLSELGDLLSVITWGDRVLFPDDPSLIPLRTLSPEQRFLGPVLFSPDVPMPPSIEALGRERSLVYATLGSSGALSVLDTVVEALSTLDVDVVLSTARRARPKRVPNNVHVVDVAPGDRLCARASLVVCNGGASTAHQALARGAPVVGFPSNLDAHLAMESIAAAGAGVLLRPSVATVAGVRSAIENALADPTLRAAARRVAASFASFDPHARFRAVVDELTVESQPEAVAPA